VDMPSQKKQKTASWYSLAFPLLKRVACVAHEQKRVVIDAIATASDTRKDERRTKIT